MSRKKGTTTEIVNERIDYVCDLLIAGARKGDIKRKLQARYGILWRSAERDLRNARQRLLEEDSVHESVQGMISRLRTHSSVKKWLREEKGIYGRSADRVIEIAERARETRSRASLVESKIQNVEVLREVIRTSESDIAIIRAVEVLNKMLKLEHVKIDLSTHEERDLNKAIKDEIRKLRTGRAARIRLAETRAETNGNGEAEAESGEEQPAATITN